jgi:hypothetical protein
MTPCNLVGAYRHFHFRNGPDVMILSLSFPQWQPIFQTREVARECAMEYCLSSLGLFTNHPAVLSYTRTHYISRVSSFPSVSILLQNRVPLLSFPLSVLAPTHERGRVLQTVRADNWQLSLSLPYDRENSFTVTWEVGAEMP